MVDMYLISLAESVVSMQNSVDSVTFSAGSIFCPFYSNWGLSLAGNRSFDGGTRIVLSFQGVWIGLSRNGKSEEQFLLGVPPCSSSEESV